MLEEHYNYVAVQLSYVSENLFSVVTLKSPKKANKVKKQKKRLNCRSRVRSAKPQKWNQTMIAIAIAAAAVVVAQAMVNLQRGVEQVCSLALFYSTYLS